MLARSKSELGALSDRRVLLHVDRLVPLSRKDARSRIPQCVPAGRLLRIVVPIVRVDSDDEAVAKTQCSVGNLQAWGERPVARTSVSVGIGPEARIVFEQRRAHAVAVTELSGKLSESQIVAHDQCRARAVARGEITRGARPSRIGLKLLRGARARQAQILIVQSEFERYGSLSLEPA